MLELTGGAVTVMWWHQGEENAASGRTAVVDVLGDLDAIRQLIADRDAAVSQSDVLVVLSGLGPQTGGGPSDAAWYAMNDCIRQIGNEANYIYAGSNMSASLVDTIHWDAESYARDSELQARALGDLAGVTTGFALFEISSATVVDGTTVDVTLSQGLGTDYTPTTGIAGFEVSDDGGSTWAAATGARQSATVLRLTHSLSGACDRVRYNYGINPGGIVRDNGSVGPADLEVTDGVAVT
jgi:hypothetical protein